MSCDFSFEVKVYKRFLWFFRQREITMCFVEIDPVSRYNGRPTLKLRTTINSLFKQININFVKFIHFDQATGRSVWPVGYQIDKKDLERFLDWYVKVCVAKVCRDDTLPYDPGVFSNGK